MNSELNKLLNSNSDLEDYINKYSNDSLFLFKYYMQDPKRINKNYYMYHENMSIASRVELAYHLLDFEKDNREALHFVLGYLVNYQFSKRSGKMITKLLSYILNLVKEGKIDLDDYGVIKGRIIDLDPIYFLNINIHNIKYVVYNDDSKVLFEVLKLCSSKKYRFTSGESLYFFMKVLDNKDLLVYFINNCLYDDNIRNMINEFIDRTDKNELFVIYNHINNQYFKDYISDILNFDNDNIDTIVNHHKYYLVVKSKEDALNLLKRIKERGLDLEIVLIVERVDLDFIDEASKTYNDKIKISPLENQEPKRVFDEVWDYPYYSIDEIKESEETLNLYASMVHDKKDKDGDIKSLSPLEKFIAAYLLTTKFSPYKEEDDEFLDYHKSRSVYELVDRTRNKRIVCVGYVHLLRELLYRMGLKDTIRWGIYSKVEGEERTHEDSINHSRLFIHLVDPKYHIDGVYMSDPTWDENFFRIITDHMLMSKKELRIIDPEITNKDLKLNSLDKVGETFKITNINEAFNKPIPDDTIVKAFLAVHRFLDINMKMLKDGEDYPFLEYADTAVSLGMGFNKVERNQIVSDLIDLTPKEVLEYQNLNYIFTVGFAYYLERALSRVQENVNISIHCDEENKLIKVCAYVNPRNVNLESLRDKYEILVSGTNEVEFVVTELSDKPIISQYMDIINSIKNFNKIVYKNPLESNNQSVK